MGRGAQQGLLEAIPRSGAPLRGPFELPVEEELYSLDRLIDHALRVGDEETLAELGRRVDILKDNISAGISAPAGLDRYAPPRYKLRASCLRRCCRIGGRPRTWRVRSRTNAKGHPELVNVRDAVCQGCGRRSPVSISED